MKNSEAETEARPGTVELLSRLFPQTQTQLTSLRVFELLFSSASQSSPLPLGRRKLKSLSSSLSPRGLFISSPHHFSPHGNMSGVIGEVRQRYSNQPELLHYSALLWSHADRRAAGWKTSTLFNGASVKMMECSAVQPAVKSESFRETIQPQPLSSWPTFFKFLII